MFNRQSGSLSTWVTRRKLQSRLVSGAAALVACLLAINFSAYAQTTSGSIGGLVHDAQGALIPAVTVSALNNAGVFVFSPLPASTFIVKGEKE